MTEWTREQRRWLRGGIAVLAVTPALVGIWALASPRGFYDDFPGGGHHWVSAVGAYDEHLVRDVGSFELALVALAVFALVTLDRRLVQGALLAFLVSGLPHFVYHATATEPLSTADAVAELLSLALGFVVPIVLLPLTRTRRAEVVR